VLTRPAALEILSSLQQAVRAVNSANRFIVTCVTVQGKAATLSNMGWAAGQQGDAQRKRELYLDAARALADMRAWTDLITVLGNLGAGDDPESTHYLAAAVWLLLRATAPLNVSIHTAAGLLSNIGPADQAGPLVAAAALYFAATRGEKDPRLEEMQQLATAMMAKCAETRGIEAAQFEQWLADEGLLDAARWLPKLDVALIQLVGGDEHWLFDRDLLPEFTFGDSNEDFSPQNR